MKMGTLFLLVVAVIAAAAISFSSGCAFAVSKFQNIGDPQAIIITGLIAAALAFVTAFIAIWGVYSQRVLARRQATIEHLAHLKADAEVQNNIKRFIDLTTTGENLGKWADDQHKASDEARVINNVLNDYELISIGIQRGIFEYELVERWNRTSIQRYWSKAHPYVAAVRDRVGAQTLWQEFEKLNSWVSGTEPPLRSLWWTGFG